MARYLTFLRSAPSFVLALCGSAGVALAGGQGDWTAKKSEAAPYCGALEGLVKQQIDNVRAIKAALRESEAAPSTSVLEMAQKAMGTPYESDWQREQKRLIEKHKAEAVELNERYKDQRCGSIDVEKEVDRPPEKKPEIAVPMQKAHKKVK